MLELIGVDAYLLVFVRMPLSVLNNNVMFEEAAIVNPTIANLSCKLAMAMAVGMHITPWCMW